jgi:Predicted membrane protein
MGLFRQGSQFLIIGLLQLALDWAVFVVATALGMPPVPGNVLARSAGALLGFWLNGRYTFASAGHQRLGWKRFGRFLAIWVPATA